jgi:hypothetical protein
MNMTALWVRRSVNVVLFSHMAAVQGQLDTCCKL